MEKQEFFTTVKTNVLDFLNEHLSVPCQTSMKVINKSNCLSVVSGSRVSAWDIEKNFENGDDAYKLSGAIAQSVISISDFNEIKDIPDVNEYANVKDKLIFLLTNITMNKTQLKDISYSELAGFAVYSNIILDMGDMGMMPFVIKNSLREKWGITPKQLYDDTMNSNLRMFPAIIEDFHDGHGSVHYKKGARFGCAGILQPGILDMVNFKAGKVYFDLNGKDQAIWYKEEVVSEDEKKLLVCCDNGTLGNVTASKKVYPNDPCPCGSGKKYKYCCGKES